MKKVVFFIAVIFCGIIKMSTAQNVGISSESSLPHPSAGLDINFTDRGLLIPRVSLVNTTSAGPVTDPATSLLVYNTATVGDVTPGYYFWNGSAWTRLSGSLSGSGTANYLSKWTGSGTIGSSQVYDDGANVGIGTATPGAKMEVAGRISQTSTGYSVFIGEGAGANDNMTDNQNVFVGFQAGYSNTEGFSNTAQGYNALYSNIAGNSNTAIGYGSLLSSESGWYNTGTGLNALVSNTSGYSNTANGSFTLGTNTEGIENSAFGYLADVSSAALFNATAIGARSAVGASNSLVLGSIAGVNYAPYSVNVGIGTTTPVARLDVVGNIKITDGTQGANKILTSDANGLASWQTLTLPSSVWSLTGNAGIVPGTNFIGTTDNASFDIQTNNMLRTRITTKGAIETYNTGYSVFIGEGAGANDDLGYRMNAFVGYASGNSNTTGFNNTATGGYSLLNNTTGSSNVANGTEALKSNSSGWGNTANGNGALYNNTIGIQNTANGMNSLYTNSSGNNNVAEGLNALFYNTTGESNAAIGTYALDNNESGSFNTAVGTFADVVSDDLYNATAIGANAMVGASNSLVLGSIADINFATTSVNVGIGTTIPTARLHVVGSVKIEDGMQGANKVLTSDAIGLASWQTLSLPPAGWSLTGNTGTVNGTNFIGTTDNSAMDIRTNNILRTRITTKGAIETYNAGQSVFIGEGAGENDDLNNRKNVFVGYMSGNFNITGEGNTAIGYQTLSDNTDGFFNVAIGKNALFGNTSGFQNSANGGYALYSNSSGDNNTAFGVSALYNNADGDENTACGSFALVSNAQGRFNSAIGSRADVATANLTNATAIGAQAFVGANNSLVLGSIAGVNNALASINVGIGTTTPGARLDVAGGDIRTDNQFISTVATGTAPLSITSTTLVSNLNSDQLDGQHAAAFAPVSGSSNYIHNSSAMQSSSNFNISGNGYIGGNVGIGTTSPATKLDVNGTIKMPSLLFYPPTGDPSPSITARTVPAGQGNSSEKTELIIFHGNDGDGGSGADQISLRAPALNFQTFDNATVDDVDDDAGYFVRLYITPSGNVGIGTSTPGEKLEVAGGVKAKFNYWLLSNNTTPTLAGMRHDGNNLLYVYNDNACNNGVYLAEGGTSWLAFSDARLKKDVEPFGNILDNVCQLNAKRFHMITDPDTMTKRMGFIAQDVQRLFPDIVNSESGFLALSYSDFGVLSIEAIKELRAEKDAEIAALKNENGELEKKLESLQAQIEQIQQYLDMSSQLSGH